MIMLQTSNVFGIEVNFLTGRYVATSHSDRERAEWPPHVARLFSTLVATWAEDGHDPNERTALEWLEAQDPPAISASRATPRKVVSYFVPVPDVSIIGLPFHEKKAKAVWNIQDKLDLALTNSNEKNDAEIARLREEISMARDVKAQVESMGRTNPSLSMEMFPEGRVRKERFFPSVTPAEPRVTYVWRTAPPDKIGTILDNLLDRVTRLGHSSSLVSCQVVGGPIAANYLPDDAGESMRVVRRGQLAALAQLYKMHQGIRPRSLPHESVRYKIHEENNDAAPVQSSTMSGEWVVFEFAPSSRMLPSTRTAEVARVMRHAIMCHTTDPIPEGISGHRPGGKPTTKPHIAFLPLPYIGHRHSDGRLLGVALSFPQLLDDSSRRAALRAIGHWEEKNGGELELQLRSGKIRMSRLQLLSALQSLLRGSWNGPSRRWITATPVALPRHPGRLGGADAATRSKAWMDAESAVADACTHVGLPRPYEVSLSLGPFLAGAYHAARFPPFIQTGRDGKKIRRQLVHALVTFEHPVTGPLVLGAGRFMGLGLMRPTDIRTPQEEGIIQ